MANDREWILQLCDCWDREAFNLDQQAARGGDYTDCEKRLLRAQANVNRARAAELRLEARKVRRG